MVSVVSGKIEFHAYYVLWLEQKLIFCKTVIAE
jgi:hypothetical protein